MSEEYFLAQKLKVIKTFLKKIHCFFVGHNFSFYGFNINSREDMYAKCKRCGYRIDTDKT